MRYAEYGFLVNEIERQIQLFNAFRNLEKFTQFAHWRLLYFLAWVFLSLILIPLAQKVIAQGDSPERVTLHKAFNESFPLGSSQIVPVCLEYLNLSVFIEQIV
mmetsp:Transcript_41777/g.40130  ORF Transcript_41777/g.40130 Transcript_41777/m.40130 type:complete len:103 (-) Transcript_41777:595-903(-)